MKEAHGYTPEETNLILQKLQSDLEEAKAVIGKPKRMYKAYKEYILGVGIDNLNRLLTYSLTDTHKTHAEELLRAYEEVTADDSLS